MRLIALEWLSMLKPFMKEFVWSENVLYSPSLNQ